MKQKELEKQIELLEKIVELQKKVIELQDVTSKEIIYIPYPVYPDYPYPVYPDYPYPVYPLKYGCGDIEYLKYMPHSVCE